jgi:hypothetical protein
MAVLREKSLDLLLPPPPFLEALDTVLDQAVEDLELPVGLRMIDRGQAMLDSVGGEEGLELVGGEVGPGVAEENVRESIAREDFLEPSDNGWRRRLAREVNFGPPGVMIHERDQEALMSWGHGVWSVNVDRDPFPGLGRRRELTRSFAVTGVRLGADLCRWGVVNRFVNWIEP